MGKVKEWLIQQQENDMEQDDIDAMWHQKELEEQQQQENEELRGLVEQATNMNLFEYQSMLDAIAYGYKPTQGGSKHGIS
jgi:hypothetical protein